jgi:hypothetical protein
MNDVAKVIDEVHKLSAEDVGKVLDFIDQLKSTAPKPGSVDAVMQSFGSWKMTDDEYEQFMKDIADCRQVEALDYAIKSIETDIAWELADEA